MNSHFAKTLEDRLRGVNLAELSRELDLPSTLLFEWKSAKRSPSFKSMGHIQKLAVYFGLSLEELLVGENTTALISSVMFEDRGNRYRIKIERLK